MDLALVHSIIVARQAFIQSIISSILYGYSMFVLNTFHYGTTKAVFNLDFFVQIFASKVL